MEIIKPNLCKYIGEGPYWDHRTQELSVIDIALDKDTVSTLYRWNPLTDTLKSFKMERATTFNIPCSDPNWSVIGTNRRFSLINWSKKKDDVDFQRYLAEVEKGDDMVRFNDAKCDRNGILYAGIMSEEISPGVLARENAGILFRYDGIEEAQVMDRGIQLSNGLDWSLDGSTMYFTDSVARKIYVYDYDQVARKVVKRKGALDMSKFKKLDGYLPDGITMDINGHLWVAFFFGGCVVQFDLGKEEILQIIRAPTSCTTSCCFGGPQLTDLYVTSCTLGVNSDPSSTDYKTAGSLMKISGAVHGTKGAPMNYFRIPE